MLKITGRRGRIRLVKIIFLGGAGLWGAACADTTEPQKSPMSPQASAARLALAVPERPRGIEDRFLKIEQELPGFGGYYLDSDGKIVVRVTDLNRSEAAVAAVAAQIAEMPDVARGLDGTPRSIRATQGDFSISQLIAWQEGLRLAGVFQYGATLLV